MRYVAKRSMFLFFMVLAFGIMIIRPFSINYALYDLMPTETSRIIPDAVQQKISSQLNVIFEAKDFSRAKQAADTFYQKLQGLQIKNISYHAPNTDLEKIRDYLKKYQYAFLAEKDRIAIKNGDTTHLVNDSINHVLSSLMPPVLSLVDDPFSLASKYTESLFKNPVKWRTKDGVLWQYDNHTNYILMNIEINPDDVDVANHQVETIMNCLNYNKNEVSVHLTGVPLHTYKMYTRSQIEIMMISGISFISILVLSFLLLKKWQMVGSVFFNLLVGFFCGTIFLYLFFDEVHVLAFAFGASLIGLCIDYSFHKMYAGNSLETTRNMFHSFLTTICCFVPLIFSEIPLLCQIAAFTLGGLIGTFIWINLDSKRESKVNSNPFQNFPFFSHKQRKIIFEVLFLCIVLGFGSFNLHTDISDFYTPDDELKKEEQLFYHLNNTDQSSLLLVQGKTLEDVLQKEEKLREHYNGFGLSYFLPSVKTQKENYELIQKLYNEAAQDIADDLGLEEKPMVKPQNILNKKGFTEAFGKVFFDKFIIKDKEKIWLIFACSSSIHKLPENVFRLDFKKSLNSSIQMYTKKALQALIAGFVFLALIIIYFYRRRAILYLLPSLFSVAGTLVFINRFNGSVSFFHVISLFIVVGLSIDYTIFHLNSKNNITCKPVMFSFVSSVIGFGLLSFISFNVVAVMGQTIAAGLSISYILSLMLVGKQSEHTSLLS